MDAPFMVLKKLFSSTRAVIVGGVIVVFAGYLFLFEKTPAGGRPALDGEKWKQSSEVGNEATAVPEVLGPSLKDSKGIRVVAEANKPPNLLGSNRSVDNLGAIVRLGVESTVPSEQREALELLQFCKAMPETLESGRRRLGKASEDAAKVRVAVEALEKTQASCQTIEVTMSQAAPGLAMRHFETGAIGSAALVSRQYPQEASRVPREQMFQRLSADAYSGHEDSIGFLASQGREFGMSMSEWLGFQLASAKLADMRFPSAQGRFGELIRASIGSISPESQRVCDLLIDKVIQLTRK